MYQEIIYKALGLVYGLLIANKRKVNIFEKNSLPEKELYNLFIENGLVVSEELKSNLSEEEIAKMLKEDFSLLTQGITSRSHDMYLELGKEVKRVYELLVKKSIF